MHIKGLMGLAIFGIALGIISVVVYNQSLPTLPPLSISYNPYKSGVYAQGIIESDEATGFDVNIFPEVAGTVVQVFVHEGQRLNPGELLLALDDSVQKSVVERDLAQVRFEEANLLNVKEQFDKIK